MLRNHRISDDHDMGFTLVAHGSKRIEKEMEDGVKFLILLSLCCCREKFFHKVFCDVNL